MTRNDRDPIDLIRRQALQAAETDNFTRLAAELLVRQLERSGRVEAARHIRQRAAQVLGTARMEAVRVSEQKAKEPPQRG